ncbi:MAG: protein kinase family protein, partial [Planctomycetaceae bacterium]
MPLIAPAQSRLEAALDAFERDWSTTVKGIPSIEQLLATHDLGDCPDAITEVIRVEIDRLCSLGADVNLRQYFDRFPCLKLDSQHALALAFEDFRSRWTRGYSCRPDRWEWIPQIQGQGWFASLPHESTGIIEKATGDSTAAHAPSSVGAPVRAGQRLGEFELLSTLGTGAFSTVFLARQHSLEGRYVAVKVVNRPMREPAHLARLLHSGIVPLYSYHRIKSYWVLCMPYAGSVTLADWQASQPAAGSRTGQSLMATVAAANDRLTVTEQDGESDGLTTLSVAQLKSVNDWNTTGAQLLGRVAHFDA